MCARRHHKNSRHCIADIGPFTITGEGQDGEVFLHNFLTWLRLGNARLAAIKSTEAQQHAFLNPHSGLSFNGASYWAWFKRHVREATGLDIPPNRLRHIFISERLSEDAVAGPSNAGIAAVSAASPPLLHCC